MIVTDFFRKRRELLEAFNCPLNWKNYPIEDYTKYYWLEDSRKIVFSEDQYDFGEGISVKPRYAMIKKIDPATKQGKWEYSHYVMILAYKELSECLAIFDKLKQRKEGY